jgi:hypothetical protein
MTEQKNNVPNSTIKELNDLFGIDIENVIERNSKTAIKHGLFLLGQIMKLLSDAVNLLSTINFKIDTGTNTKVELDGNKEAKKD